MSKSNIEIRAEKVEHLMETLNTIFLGFIPGGHAAEAFLNYRQDLKTNRVLKFLESFSNALQEIAEEIEIDMSVFTSEDFVDVFDAIITRVQNTKSEIKLIQFKRILQEFTIDPQTDLMIYKFIDLIDRLNEIQILILKKILNETSAPRKQDKTFDNIKFHMDPITNGFKIEISMIKGQIQDFEIEYYFNELVYLGLLTTQYNVVSTTKGLSIGPKKNQEFVNEQIYFVTEIGQQLINKIIADD